MENKTSDEKKESKINQNILIAIIGAVTTIVAAALPLAWSRFNTQPLPTAAPLVITATMPVFPTVTLTPMPTEIVAPTFTPTTEPPTATATLQTGVFNASLSSDDKGIIPITTFTPTQTIYLLFDINDPTGKNIVNIRWSTVQVKGYKADAEITSSPYTVKNNHFGLGFDHTGNPWRPGKYKVEISMNGETKAIEFDIAP